MSRSKRILVVEDRERWREALSDNLQRVGFQVDTAATTEQVREQLNHNFYHLIILDIRLDEADQTNTEGMDLLQELNSMLGTSVAVVMLSGYGTREQMRAAFKDYKVADFLEKQNFDNIKFRKQINELFEQEVPINLGLDIYWQDVSGPEETVVGVEVDRQPIGLNTPLQTHAAAELDDLLCRLFHDANSILVKPLVPGYSGAGVLWVQPFFINGGGQATVVKFGDFRKIDEEYRNFDTYVRSFVGGGRRTEALKLQRTARLGGIVYSLLGATGDYQEDFGSYYRRSQIAEIKEVLDCLFRDTCGAWYASPGRLQPHYLTADYQKVLGFTEEQLTQMIRNELAVQANPQLRFNNLATERLFRNPIVAISGRHLVQPTYLCTTHGDLNDRNILVDRVGQVWLIDFRHTGPAHILRDVAGLDAVVRFQLLLAAEATLAERLEMEERLCRLTRFSQVEQLTGAFSTENPALAKVYAISVYLRDIARKLVAQNPSDDFSEYHIASLYHALNHIRFPSLPPEQREHALLSASLLVEQLDL